MFCFPLRLWDPVSDAVGPTVGIPVAPSWTWFFHAPACSRQLQMAACMGVFGFFGACQGQCFPVSLSRKPWLEALTPSQCVSKRLSAYPESHGWRSSLLLSVSPRGCACWQHCCSWNSSSWGAFGRFKDSPKNEESCSSSCWKMVTCDLPHHAPN